MSDNLKKIVYLEDKLNEYLEHGLDTTNVECEKVVLQISSLLKKINNDDLIYLLQYGTGIHEVVDVTSYFNKYKIDKKKLKETKEYKETFKKLNLFIQRIRDACITEQEYNYICYLTDIDNGSNYLLKQMNNEEIMELANESDNWNYKLFLFEYLKK